MIKLGYKKGDNYFFSEISVKQYEKLVTMSMYNVVKLKNVKLKDFHILVVSRETYNILMYLFNNEVDF